MVYITGYSFTGAAQSIGIVFFQPLAFILIKPVRLSFLKVSGI